VRLPSGYRRFLEIADGADSPVMRILGHRDTYRADDPPFDGIVVAWDSDHADDFLAIVGSDGSDEAVRRLDVHEDPRRLRDLATDMQAYLRARFQEHP
jgi:hypothetical protein